jgi:hypothetical protein
MFLPSQSLGIGPDEKLGVGVDLYLQIDGDIDEYYQELKGKGVTILLDIKDEPYGIRDFTVEDIDGYKLTFNQTSQAAKVCMSCGMPMTKPEEFGGGSEENIYCVHCTNPDGTLKSQGEVFAGMVDFMMRMRNLDRVQAEIAAKKHMASMPAWSDKV